MARIQPLLNTSGIPINDKNIKSILCPTMFSIYKSMQTGHIVTNGIFSNKYRSSLDFFTRNFNNIIIFPILAIYLLLNTISITLLLIERSILLIEEILKGGYQDKLNDNKDDLILLFKCELGMIAGLIASPVGNLIDFIVSVTNTFLDPTTKDDELPAVTENGY